MRILSLVVFHRSNQQVATFGRYICHKFDVAKYEFPNDAVREYLLRDVAQKDGGSLELCLGENEKSVQLN